MQRTAGIISTFIRHPNAANLLMVLMIIFGVFALARINTQFFPTIETSSVRVSISWSGASAEDVETNILALVEPSVRYLEGVDDMTSFAREGSASITLTFTEGYDMQKAVADVETAVNTVSNLPEDSDDPDVSRSEFFDRVGNIAITGPDEEQVRTWAKRMRDELVNRGIDRVTFTGLRAPEIRIKVPERELRRLGITLADISRAIAANSRDLPSGNLEGDVERQLRTLADAESRQALARIEIRSLPSGEKIYLEDIAAIDEGYDDSVRGLSGANPAIELQVQRLEATDTLVSNRIMQDYVAEVRPQLPAGMGLTVYEVRAEAVAERIMLLVKNGASGLVLVLIVLFIFLNARIAFWVAAGIPVALLATIGLMYVSGQTINMISLFGLIMMLGIIVDDAIVVGEHTDTRLRMGDDPVTAAENGVGQMFTPVTAALVTTMATFSPLLLITGGIGQIIGVLPLVVIAVAVSSIIECFFILPAHLSHSLAGRRRARWSHWRVLFVAFVVGLFALALVTRAPAEGGLAMMAQAIRAFADWQAAAPVHVWAPALAAGSLAVAAFAELLILLVRRTGRSKAAMNDDSAGADEEGWFRRNFDRGFDWVRDNPFSWLVTLSYRWRYVTVAFAIGLVMVFAVGLIRGGQVGFVFFPSPEAENISGSITFHPGTPEEVAVAAIARYQDALRTAETSLTDDGEQLVRATFVTLGQSGRRQGENIARIDVQLTTSETRSVRTPDIVNAWNRAAPDIAAVSRFSVRQSRGGPPGADIDVELSGPSIGVLKEASQEVTAILAAISGVSGVEDDLPYGKPEIVMTLLPRGAALGFTVEEVGRQVRNAFDGAVPRRFARGDDEVTVRLTMQRGTGGTAALRTMQLRSPAGNYVPLTEIVTLDEAQGFSTIQRKNGRTTISVTGDIDIDVNTTDGVVEQLTASGALDAVARKYGIEYRFGGRSEEQREAFKDLGIGTVIAMSVIYIVLAWVFGSYFRPFAVMGIIPFGIVGAVVGHWLLGFQLTILSMIGLLGLSGILVNDSIILVSRLDERIRAGDDVHEAAIGASRDRLRAVLLTSLTTIGGLVPLLFETSLQAQFLMPMAITMVFGLASATLLVLFLVPSFIGIGVDIRSALIAVYGRRQTRQRDTAPPLQAGE